MAAVTDLNWTDLNAGLRKLLDDPDYNFIYIDTTATPPRLRLDISALMPGSSSNLNNAGGIKLLAILFDAARLQQETLNQGKAVGEKLTAFPAPTFGTLANGYAPITRTLTARAVLSSATQIVGTNA